MKELSVAFEGAMFMAGLICGLGPQNLHLINAALSNKRITLVVLVCCIGDLLFIPFGVLGLGQFNNPLFLSLMKGGAVILLLYYGFSALERGLKGTDQNLRQSLDDQVLYRTFALTFFNPGVYLDSVILVGLRANSYGGLKWEFALGSILVSVIWYASVGFGFKKLNFLFSKDGTRRSLDLIMGGLLFLSAWMMSFS
jgi:L-lysine exporter family protein LysE/ArgO